MTIESGPRPAVHPRGVDVLTGPAASRFAEHTPQTLFAIDRREDWGVTGLGMHTGPWMTDAEGVHYPSSVAIMMDSVLCGPLFVRRPGPTMGMATSELSLDFVPAATWQGPELSAASELMQIDASGGLTRGDVRDSSGNICATGTLWGRFFPIASGDSPSEPMDIPGPDPTATLTDMFCGVPQRTHSGSELQIAAAPWLNNPRQVMHGGVLATLSDYVAVAALDGGAARWSPLSLRTNYFRPAVEGDKVTVVAEAVQRGRSLAVMRVRTMGASGKPFTHSMVSYAVKP
ncbi:PaaI family thioesterase [Rhodococcus cercidiphylli]|uniref:PaaI family thioesterase n=1 Tax=Rhodococcus cercidiphylli TaxID=489916 RepID=A0ABU4AWE7_9NOCA|nr:PaaI family thioesterase [Rhodococcus cercidiphylli]MDV6230551.1 PaaI family thioesterase [Rhodococcus cercidiphylli]